MCIGYREPAVRIVATEGGLKKGPFVGYGTAASGSQEINDELFTMALDGPYGGFKVKFVHSPDSAEAEVEVTLQGGESRITVTANLDAATPESLAELISSSLDGITVTIEYPGTLSSQALQDVEIDLSADVPTATTAEGTVRFDGVPEAGARFLIGDTVVVASDCQKSRCEAPRVGFFFML